MIYAIAGAFLAGWAFSLSVEHWWVERRQQKSAKRWLRNEVCELCKDGEDILRMLEGQS